MPPASATQEARTTSDTAARLRQLTGTPQGWLHACAAARRAGPAATAALLDPPGPAPDLEALRASPRVWPAGSRERDTPVHGAPAHDGPDDDGLGRLRAANAAARAEAGPDVSAARAVAAVAAALTGALPRPKALGLAADHWRRACLPAFDGPGRFPDAMFADVDEHTRAWLGEVASADGVRCRGFLALLALELTGCPPPAGRRDAQLGVLFDRRSAGSVGQLRLRLRPGGPAGLHPEPGAMAFLVADEAFAEALRRAWRASRLRAAGACVTWSVVEGDEPSLDVAHGSLGAAFAVGLHELDRRRTLRRGLRPKRLDARTAVTGAVDARARRLEPVAGEITKIDAAVRGRLRRVVVPAPSLPAFRAAYGASDSPDPADAATPFELVGAATVAEAVRRARTQVDRRFVSAVLAAVLVAAVAAPFLANAVSGRRAAEADSERRRMENIAAGLLANAESTVDSDPRTALRLALAADSISPGPRSRSRLAKVLLANPYRTSLTGLGAVVSSVASSGDGRLLAVASQGEVVLWDIPASAGAAEPTARATRLVPEVGRLNAVRFAPGRPVLVALGPLGAQLWDVADPTAPRRLTEALTVGPARAHSVAFSPDGRRLAVGGEFAFGLWDVTDPASPARVGGYETATNEFGWVMALAFAPDGSRLALGDQFSLVTVWEVADPTAPRLARGPLTGHAGNIVALAFSPDGSLLASADDHSNSWHGAGGHEAGDGEGRVWAVGPDVPAGQERVGDLVGGHAGALGDLAFAPDGRTVATAGDDGKVVLWDVGTPYEIRRLGSPLVSPGGTAVHALAFTPDGQTLAAGGEDGMVVLWDTATPQLLTAHAAPVGTATAVAFSTAGDQFATVYGDTLTVWDVAGTETRPAAGDLPVAPVVTAGGVAFAPDRPSLLAVAGRGSTGRPAGTVLVDSTARTTQPLPASSSGAADAVAFSPDGRVLVTGGGGTTKFVLWDVADPASPRRLGAAAADGTGALTAARFSPSGGLLAVGSRAGHATLWDVRDPARPEQIVPVLAGAVRGVRQLAFTPDGRRLAVATGDEQGTTGDVALWDVADPAAPRRIGAPLPTIDDPPTTVDVSPDGTLLITGSVTVSGGYSSTVHSTLQLWDITDPAAPWPMGGPVAGYRGAISSVAFSPDGRTVAAASAAGTVASRDDTALLWDATAATSLRAEAPARACARAAGGLTRKEWAEHIAAPPYRPTCPGDDDAEPAGSPANVPGSPTGEVPSVGAPLTGHTKSVTALATSPAGALLASGASDGTVRLWDLSGPGRGVGPPLTTRAKSVSRLAFSPDGRLLAASAHRSVLLWDVSVPANPRPLDSITAPPTTALQFSDDGHTLAAWAGGGLRTWDVSDPSNLRRLPTVNLLTSEGEVGLGSGAAISKDLTRLVVGTTDGTLLVWDVADPAAPRELSRTKANSGVIHAVGLSPDGRTLACGTSAGVRLWELPDSGVPEPLGTPLHTANATAYDLEFSADGRRLAAGLGGLGDESLLWDVSDPRRPILPGRTIATRAVVLALTADGRTVATGTAAFDDHSIRLWDLGR